MQFTVLPQDLSEDITTDPQGSYRGCQGHSTHEHQFTPVWSADCTLASLCKCGEKQECDINQLQEFLRQCISLKAEYLQERDKCSSIAQSQKFANAIAVKDRQITWLERQIEVSSLPNSSLSSTSTCSYLALDEIRRDGGTQPRAAIDLKHVKLLEEQIEDGKELEPVTVFYDGESYWLADGFHRWHAHRNSRKEAITCFIHSGTRRDAVLYSVSANADHKPALPRSREDKQRAVMTVVLQKLDKDGSEQTILIAFPLVKQQLQKFSTRILLAPGYLLWQHLELVLCESYSSPRTLLKFASQC